PPDVANTKISALPAAADVTDVDVLPIVQSGITKKSSLLLLKDHFNAGLELLDGTDALRPIETLTLDINEHIRFVYVGGTVDIWLLTDGTNPDDPDGGYVRPDDYAEVDNEKVWHRSGTASSGIANAIQTVRVIPISDVADPTHGSLLVYDE